MSATAHARKGARAEPVRRRARGYYPDAPTKDNQDAYSVLTAFGGAPGDHFFGVFDGHGEKGTQCAQFAADKVRTLLPPRHAGPESVPHRRDRRHAPASGFAPQR